LGAEAEADTEEDNKLKKNSFKGILF